MAKKQIKAERKRLLDLMINSIYTNKEIFLREIISNASDAIDKLCYISLTDDKVGMNRDDFRILVSMDENARTITVSDNGVGMDAEQRRKLLRPEASKGLGIAMKNINERLRGYFGTESRMEVDSTPGNGTRVTMFMKDGLVED